ncbi:MAG: bifunctional hydroxymethylpyrimidine kinase/phosphomethylpyrimidine kinase [Paramuribaculum sp.]|nr:bifunctional hydroxymethylpyrimidine kinase/phosphomethylpyrimidine kinase [Paramuribaculum sp.]MDE7452082.1 bifunctional hydroxymethylpyrimidine kinase/phosphomethylpyrimidine kinase [Paramuribaculum sp.]
MRQYYPVLTIAGSDSSGGAGIQADIKTISAIGCYAMSAITAITAQNTTGVVAVQGIDPKIVAQQIEMVFADIPPLAVKTGMLFSKPVIEAVASVIVPSAVRKLIVDPVMISTSGTHLIAPDAVDTMKQLIFPQALLVTPNCREAVALTGETDPQRQAQALHAMGCSNVVIKGGDSDNTEIKTDFVSLDCGADIFDIRADAVNTVNTHGTGCTFSAAIASYMALGYSLADAIKSGKLFVTKAIENGAYITCGHGHGPVNHFFNPRRLKNFNPKSI